jgi:hypothetical protein
VLLADLDQVDGPREPRLVGVRRIAAGDEYAPDGIHPALGVAVSVHVLAAHDPILSHADDTRHELVPARANGGVRTH